MTDRETNSCSVKPWQMTVIEYLSPGYLVSQDKEPYLHDGYFLRPVLKLMSRDPAGVEGWKPLPGHDGIDYALAGHHDASLRDNSSGELIGGYCWTLPYLDPAWRGRGIMAALNFHADEAGLRFTTQNYTISGFMTRTKTHALHVAAAVSRGEHVPGRVLAEYEFEGDIARLREPMTRDRYYHAYLDRRALLDRMEELMRDAAEPTESPAFS